MSSASQHIGEDERFLVRYLLGELPEPERERLQEAYFADAGLFAQLLAAEDDLIDAYVRGTLTSDERARFEERFRITSGQLQRLKFAPMLQQAADRRAAEMLNPQNVRSWRGAEVWRAPAIAAAIVAAIVGVTWWAVGHDVEPSHRATTRQTVPPRHTNPPAVQEQRPVETVASLLLRPGLTRESGSVARLVLPAGTTSVQIRVLLDPALPSGYSGYQAVVETATGVAVVRQDALASETDAGGTFISLRVPASSLARKDYVVMLSGVRADGTRQFLSGYPFNVSR